MAPVQHQFTLWSAVLVMQATQRPPNRTAQSVLLQRIMAAMLLKLILTKTLTILATMIRKSCECKDHNPTNEVVRYFIDKHRRKSS